MLDPNPIPGHPVICDLIPWAAQICTAIDLSRPIKAADVLARVREKVSPSSRVA